jgi:Abortive infection alpha
MNKENGIPRPSIQVDPEIKFKIGENGAEINVRANAVERLGDQLADLISPLTEGLGWVGDQLSASRRASAIRAAAKARDMLREEGIVRGSVEPKILLPWLEGASLETDGPDSLSDMWAGLLARAVKSSDAVSITYIETLRKLGSKEAQLLHFFATDTSPEISTKFFGDIPDSFSPTTNPLLQDAINKLEERMENEKLGEIFEDFFLQGMGQIILYSVDAKGLRSTPYFDVNEHAVSNLEHLGLIVIRRKRYRSTNHVFDLIWFEITKFAFDFFWACDGVVTGGGIEKLQARASKTAKAH